MVDTYDVSQFYLRRNSQLSTKDKDVARQKLNEIPEEVEAEIAKFQSALSNRHHIIGNPPDKICLAFLRRTNFRLNEALNIFDNFYTMQYSTLCDQQKWFNSTIITDEIMKSYLENGVHIPLGYLDDGCMVLLIRWGSWDFRLANFNVYMRLATRQLELMMEYPRVQVNGLKFIFDMDNITLECAWRMNPKELLGMFMQFIQFIRVGNNIEKAFEILPGLKELLPVEYGGRNGPITELINERTAQYINHFSKPNIWKKVKVDEYKREVKYQNLLPKYETFSEISASLLVPLPLPLS